MSATSAKSKADYSQWPTKHQVATILDCSTKTVERFDAEGKLQSASWKRPSGGPAIMVYHPGDVEVLRKDRNPDSPSTFVMPAPIPGKLETAIATTTTTAASDLVLELRNLVAAMMQQTPRLLEAGTPAKAQKPFVPVELRVYLTVREAAAYLGRPERHVRDLVGSGKLKANTDGYTRVRRADLDRL